ncbi:unnamed protein product [Miscanthus lutarioriparius]|uniref:BI1-like protein n=1 Tax=Miscanthus lutarioriparius TaxID=422564 RepID=A0A811NQU5_9POAL|nr:unnamed protein product [Miscanthus lutarioriparius]
MFGYQKGVDVEAGTSGGARQLYPGMQESPELRWALIRKIYVILSLQLLLTAVVAAVVVKVRAIPTSSPPPTPGSDSTSSSSSSPSSLESDSDAHVLIPAKSASPASELLVDLVKFGGILSKWKWRSLACSHPCTHRCRYLVARVFFVLCPLYFYHEKHPVNLILLGLFTVAISFSVGLTCAFTSGKVILESAILTTVVVLSLTAYTFWAVNRGKDFSFLGPFLFASLIVLLVFALIQILFPLGKLSQMIYGGLASLIFSGYIVYDTNNIIRRFTYDQYVWAAVSLYLDVINLFLSLMTLFRAAD